MLRATHFWRDRLEGQLIRGTIKKIIIERGFGFILAEDGKEIFFHRSGLQGVPFETLREGQAVQFDIEDAGRGPRANNVRPAE